jgi:putative endonuclease
MLAQASIPWPERYLMKHGYVYIMSDGFMGTLYIGVTSDLIKRIYEHKVGAYDGFTSRYKLDKLVYYEYFADIGMAIAQEKRMKNWHRNWKVRVIIEQNPGWKDLYADFTMAGDSGLRRNDSDA